MTLSFAPANAWWFTPFCLAGLFVLLNQQAPSLSWLIGLAFGIGWFGAGFWWVAPGLNAFSQAGLWLSVALTAVLVIYMALFVATAAWALSVLPTRLSHLFSRLVRNLTCAACWTLTEWARGQLFGGLPWLVTGYSQVPGPLAVFAPVIGVFGLTFITAFLAALIADCLVNAANKAALQRAGVVAAFTGVMLAALGFGLANVQWTQDTGRTLSVRLLQGNLPQHDKFTQDGLRRALTVYGEMLQTSSTELTALPETALPIEWASLPADLRQRWQDFATVSSSAIVLGTIASTPSADGQQSVLANSAIALVPGGGQSTDQSTANYQYNKHRLIPFGEAMPRGAEWLGRQLKLDLGSFTPGPAGQPPLVLPQAKVAMSICFEDLLDTVMADKAKAAEVILNISNFAWFAHTYAPEQHLQIAQMRALETGRWVMSASNTGVTALVDQRGQVHSRLPPNKTAYLDGQVSLFTGFTPFMQWQNLPVLALSVFMIALAAAHRLRWVFMPSKSNVFTPRTSANKHPPEPT